MNYEKPVRISITPAVQSGTTKQKGSKLNLAYKFDIYASFPVSRGEVYIDAVTGEVLLYNATIKHLGEYSHGGQSKAA
jgi:hypothetical protein